MSNSVPLLSSGCGFVIGIFACVMILLGFATPFWMEPDDNGKVATGLEKLGLWEICFSGYSDARDGAGRVYNGCWWIFAREYDAIRKWILTDWYKLTQALMTINVIVSLVSVLFGLMLILKCFPTKLQRYMAAGVSCGYYSVGIFALIACTYFGTKSDNNQSWLRAPNLRHLSWSFYVSVIGGIIALAAGMCYTVLAMTIWKKGRNVTAYRAHELRHYMVENRSTDHQDGYKDIMSERDRYEYEDRSSRNNYRSDRSEKSDYYSDRRERNDNRSDRSERSDYRSDRRERSDSNSRRDNHRSDRSERGDNYRSDRSERGDSRRDNYRSDRSERSDYRNDHHRSDRDTHRSTRSDRSHRNDYRR